MLAIRNWHFFLTGSLILLAFFVSLTEAKPFPDRLGICYVFHGEKLKSRVPCVISGGFGTVSRHITLRWPDGTHKDLYFENEGDSEKITLNKKRAEEYTRSSIWFDKITGEEKIAPEDAEDYENPLSCIRALKKKTSYCYLINSD